MDWILAAAAPLAVALVLLASGAVHPALLAYHLLCAVMIFRRRHRLRSLWRWEASTALWTMGTCLLTVAVLSGAPWAVDPAPYRDVFVRTLFPAGVRPVLFALFATYTLVIHVPLEELFWRAVVTDPDRGSLPAALAGNAVFFGLLHALPLGLLLAGAGALWAFVTIRSRSLWPALVSHWGSDALLLGGMWFFFIR